MIDGHVESRRLKKLKKQSQTTKIVEIQMDVNE